MEHRLDDPPRVGTRPVGPRGPTAGFVHLQLTAGIGDGVLVVQANDLGTGLPQLIVAMVTSQMSRAGHPSHDILTWLDGLGRSRRYVQRPPPMPAI